MTKAMPTGSNGCGGSAFAASPAQKLCRSPAMVAKPVMPCRADEVVDLRALDIGSAVVAAAEAGVARAGPRLASDPREDSADRRASRACAVVLPQIFQVALDVLQTIEKPRLLLGAEDGLRRLVLAEVGDLLLAKADRRRRLAAVVRASGVENLLRLLRKKLGKSSLDKRCRPRLRPVGSSER